MLRNIKLQVTIQTFKDRHAQLTTEFQTNKSNTQLRILEYYQNAIDKFTLLQKHLNLLFHNINELAEYNEHIKVKQNILLNFISLNINHLSTYIKDNALAIDLTKMISNVKILADSTLELPKLPENDYAMTDMTQFLDILGDWLITKDNLIFFISIDHLNTNYESYNNFFHEFFKASPNIANQLTIKNALNTKETANDAIQFEKILHEPTAMFARFKLFLDNLEKYSKLIDDNLLFLHNENYPLLCKKLFIKLKLQDNFILVAQEILQGFATTIVHTKNRITRFNIRQEEVDGLIDKKAMIHLDLYQSTILRPNPTRKFEYLSCCEYYQIKLSRLLTYLNAYEERCSTLFFAKHNPTGKMFAGKVKQFWADKYTDSFITLQRQLANSENFLIVFVEQLHDLHTSAIQALQQYCDQGSFSLHSGKSYVMAYIVEIAQTIEHIKNHAELPLHPEIEDQLKMIGSTDDEREKYYAQLLSQINPVKNAI